LLFSFAVGFFSLFPLCSTSIQLKNPLFTVCCTMASAQDIKLPAGALAHRVSLSTSPSAVLHSPLSSFGTSIPRAAAASAAAKQLKPFATEDVKILLLENVNQTGREVLAGQGYQVEFLKTSLPEDELIEKIR
jgi:D-3-phosphoglycerate dehydrogenase